MGRNPLKGRPAGAVPHAHMVETQTPPSQTREVTDGANRMDNLAVWSGTVVTESSVQHRLQRLPQGARVLNLVTGECAKCNPRVFSLGLVTLRFILNHDGLNVNAHELAIFAPKCLNRRTSGYAPSTLHLPTCVEYPNAPMASPAKTQVLSPLLYRRSTDPSNAVLLCM